MLKQKLSINRLIPARVGVAGLAVALAIGLTGGLVHADQFDEQIRALESSNAAKSLSLNNLQIKANDYQDAIDKLQARINQIEGQILNTQAQQTTVKQKIDDAQVRLTHEKAVLGDAIRAMYLDSQTSTLEVLLSSNNLSDFVDQEQYHITVQNKVKTLVDQITVLKQQLKAQNDKLTRLINDQKLQQSQVVAARNQQDQLLGYNLSQQAGFNQQIQSNNIQIASLKAQQAAANTRFLGVVGSGPTCGGAYPARWCQIPQDSVSDDWGMYNRECVSYTAFRVYAAGGDMPYWGGVGNANQWPGNARAYGFQVDGSPQNGDIEVAVWTYASANGHTMFVEHVNDDGSIVVSDYNYNGDGRYGSPRTYSKSKYQSLGFQFIHFPPR